MRAKMLVQIAVFILCACSALPQDGRHRQSVQKTSSDKPYNGNWWLARNPQERSGFLEGAGDCLTWLARVPGFGAPSGQMADRITKHYETHPSERGSLFTEVWRRLASNTEGAQHHEDGEVWKNPHWYLNGLWWRQSSEEERLGFLEGYLWCVRTQSVPEKVTYSRSVSYYRSKIDDYVRTHAKADDEPIAAILAGFRDAPKAKER